MRQELKQSNENKKAAVSSDLAVLHDSPETAEALVFWLVVALIENKIVNEAERSSNGI